jgi:hypothetical protein
MLMSIDYTQLATEINTDPLNLGYAPFVANGSDTDIANLLNQDPSTFVPPQTWVTTVPFIPMVNILIWGGATGVRANVTAAANASGTFSAAPLQIQAICQTVLDLLQGAATGLDISNSNNIAMITALVSAGVMTSDQQTSLLALADQSATRAQVLFGANIMVAPSDVGQALRGN